MQILFQWIHVTSAMLGVGGVAFLLFILMPSIGVLSSEERDRLFEAVMARFRWVIWGVMILLLVSGLYMVKARYWEASWGPAWTWLTIKIVLAVVVFGISLALTLPLRVLARVRAKRPLLLAIAFGLAMVVILISAYLRPK